MAFLGTFAAMGKSTSRRSAKHPPRAGARNLPAVGDKKESPGGAFFSLMKSVSVVLLHVTHDGNMQLVQLLLPVPTK